MARDTIVDRLMHNARVRGDRPALYARRDGTWSHWTWGEYAARCREFAGALIAEGYGPGDVVPVMGNNSPEWVTADMGAMLARGVATGIYQTSTGEQAAYIVRHSDAKLVVLENKSMWDRLAPHRAELPLLKRVVMIRDAEQVDDPLVVSFDAFLAKGREHRASVDARFDEIQDADLATLIYTSGTTGPPKAVMLSHANLAFMARAACEMNQNTADDRVVSYLPLSHIAEQMVTIHIPTFCGAPVWFAEALDKVRDALLVARPTVFLGVPRVWEKFRAALEARLAEATGAKAAIVKWARDVGLRAGHERLATGRVSGLLGVQEKLAQRLFSSKLRAALGLEHLRVAVTGAAPIGRDVLEFFLSCGIPIFEVYGLSEGTGGSTYNRARPGESRIGTVGLPVPGVEVRLAEDGEIKVRGPSVFLGYFKDPDATAAMVQDGWLYTGDIGEFDQDGFLRITDRKKDLIVTSGGKNVAPQNIEKLLRRIEGVAHAVVIGDRRNYLTALITIDPDTGPALARSRGWPVERPSLCKHPEFLAHVQAGVDRANAELARYEQIKKFVVLPSEFAVETGELTPSLKIKRKVVLERHAREIEQMYESGVTVAA